MAVWALAVAFCFAPAAASSQTVGQTGTIHGVVLDTKGGAGVRDVSVRLQSTSQTTTTDADGRFTFDGAPAGGQEISVAASDFLLVKKTVSVPAGGIVEVTIALTEGTGTYAETVEVRGDRPIAVRRDPAVAAEQTIGGAELQQLRGVMTNDPLRTVQMMPSVASGDDLRSDFAVRGAGVERTNFTFEGISTPFLVHTVQQVRDGGSIAMLNGDVLDEISLRNGAYPERYGNRTGAELDFRMREGSRDRTQSHISVSALDASGVVEGPIGGGGHGSWLAAARQSYVDLLVGRLYSDQDASFGFNDAQAKFVYDVSPRNQVQAAVTAGKAALDRQPDLLTPSSLRDAANQSTVAVGSWRYIPSPRFTVTQRIAMTSNRFDNLSRDLIPLDSGSTRELIYRADVSAAPSANLLLEGGAESRWSSGASYDQQLNGSALVIRESFNDSTTAQSAYGQLRIGPANGASVTPGIRIDRRALTNETYASPWVEALWPVTSTVTLRGGAGVYRQAPEFAQVLGVHGTRTLQSERAYQADVGVEGRLGPSARWQVTLYNRADRDLFRLPDDEARVVDGLLVDASLTSHYANALDGYARGVEMLLQRQTRKGLSGWISYALGYARYTDRTTGESFWGDFDQRHTVSMYGDYRVNDRLSFSARFRAGSNFPIPGYWTTAGDNVYAAGTERNTERLPVYSRLDARANRTFTWGQKRLTVFLEGINLLNRTNERFAAPTIDRQTLLAAKMFDTMLPRIPSVGALIEF